MKRSYSRYRQQQGFTLIEMMIVVVIIAILLTIALPSFRDQIIRGHRSAAQSEMLEIANREQQYLLANRAYADQGTLGYTPPTDVSDQYTYTIAVGISTLPTFNITFTPTATGTQVNDGTLTLDHTGLKLPDGKWD